MHLEMSTSKMLTQGRQWYFKTTKRGNASKGPLAHLAALFLLFLVFEIFSFGPPLETMKKAYAESFINNG